MSDSKENKSENKINSPQDFTAKDCKPGFIDFVPRCNCECPSWNPSRVSLRQCRLLDRVVSDGEICEPAVRAGFKCLMEAVNGFPDVVRKFILEFVNR